MPYLDPDQHRAAKARWYREKSKKDPQFKEKEAARKAEWLKSPEAKAKNAEASARYRQKKAAQASIKPQS